MILGNYDGYNINLHNSTIPNVNRALIQANTGGATGGVVKLFNTTANKINVQNQSDIKFIIVNDVDTEPVENSKNLITSGAVAETLKSNAFLGKTASFFGDSITEENLHYV
jgi:hypothetical protein